VEKLAGLLDRGKRRVTLKIPYAKAGLVDTLNRDAAVVRTEYLDDGITVEAVILSSEMGRYKDFIPGYTEPKEDF
jgi:GTPase